MPDTAPGRNGRHHVPDDEPCCFHLVQCHPCRRSGHAASRDLGRDSSEELPHGVLLEHVCRRTILTLAVRKDISGKVNLPLSDPSSQTFAPPAAFADIASFLKHQRLPALRTVHLVRLRLGRHRLRLWRLLDLMRGFHQSVILFL